MTITTKYDIGDRVRVTLGDNFVGTVVDVHVEAKSDETRIWYTVGIPEENRGRGRHYVESWGYGEEYLQPV